MTSSSPDIAKQLSSRIYNLLQIAGAPLGPFVAYLLGVVLGLKGDEAVRSLYTVLPPVMVTVGMVYPHFMVRRIVTRALTELPGEPRGKRFERLLKVPWQSGIFGIFTSYLTGGLGFSLPVCLLTGRNPLLALGGMLIAGCFGLMMSIVVAIIVERWVMPLAVKAQRQYPGVRPAGGFFLQRQAWYLPYAFIICVGSFILLVGCVVAVQTTTVQRRLIEDLRAAGQDKAISLLQNLSSTFVGELSAPLGVVALVMLVVPAVSAWMLANRQARGARAVQHAIERLSAGRIESPEWASSDEIGDLAFGLQSMLAQLRTIPAMLQQSAARLVDASSSLGAANAAQRQTLSSQAAALQETSVTAQQIKQTSEVAAERAESVITVANRAEALGRSGTTAIEESLAGFVSIRDYVHDIRAKMGRLETSAQQISEITEAVKDLADQSNLLAINAAIEAARSGEHGKGFAVVAQEIRSLADQSIRATNRISHILQEVGGAMRDAVSMSDAGAAQVEGGLQRVKDSGESLRELTHIVSESSTAARQIAASVNQQNAGFNQIFAAIRDLSNGMDQAMARLGSTQEATQMLQSVSEQVGKMARQYSDG